MDEIQTCPHCKNVKGFGPYMERHIFRCGKGIPMRMPKKEQTTEKPQAESK